MKIVWIGTLSLNQMKEAMIVLEKQETTDRVQSSCEELLIGNYGDVTFKFTVDSMGVEKVIVRALKGEMGMKRLNDYVVQKLVVKDFDGFLYHFELERQSEPMTYLQANKEFETYDRMQCKKSGLTWGLQKMHKMEIIDLIEGSSIRKSRVYGSQLK